MLSRWRTDPEFRERRTADQRRWRDKHRPKLRADSAEWRQTHPQLRAEQSQRHYVRRVGAVAFPVDRIAVWLRCKGVCHLCRKPAGMHYDLRHLTPLALSGIHSEDNLAVFHSSCGARWTLTQRDPRTVGLLRHRATHCRRGHPYDLSRTGKRRCQVCDRLRRRASTR